MLVKSKNDKTDQPIFSIPKWEKKLQRESLSSGKKSKDFIPQNAEASLSIDSATTRSFDDIKGSLKTGDIFLISGTFEYSWLGKLLQWNKWLHVAMVVLPSDIDPADEYKLGDAPLFWESNVAGLKLKNIWANLGYSRFKSGPMLIPLEERLRNNIAVDKTSHFAYRPLVRNQVLDTNMLKECFNLYLRYRFPSNLQLLYSTLLGRVLNIGLPKIPILGIGKKMYCSELIAETYRRLTIISDEWVSNAYVPRDFCDEGELDYMGNTYLGNQVTIVM